MGPFDKTVMEKAALTHFPDLSPDILAALLDAYGQPDLVTLSPRDLLGLPAVFIPPKTLSLLVNTGVLLYPKCEPQALSDAFCQIAQTLLFPKTHLTFRAWSAKGSVNDASASLDNTLEGSYVFPSAVADGDGVALNHVGEMVRLAWPVSGQALMTLVGQHCPPPSMVQKLKFNAQLNGPQSLLFCYLVDELQRNRGNAGLSWTPYSIYQVLCARWGKMGLNDMVAIASAIGVYKDPPTQNNLEAICQEFTKAGWLNANQGVFTPTPKLMEWGEAFADFFNGIQWQRCSITPQGEMEMTNMAVVYGKHGFVVFETAANDLIRIYTQSRDEFMNRLTTEFLSNGQSSPTPSRQSEAPKKSGASVAQPQRAVAPKVAQPPVEQAAPPQPAEPKKTEVTLPPSPKKTTQTKPTPKKNNWLPAVLLAAGLLVLGVFLVIILIVAVILFRVSDGSSFNLFGDSFGSSTQVPKLYPLDGGYIDKSGLFLVERDTYAFTGDFNEGLALTCKKQDGLSKNLVCDYINEDIASVLPLLEAVPNDSWLLRWDSSLVNDDVMLEIVTGNIWTAFNRKGATQGTFSNVDIMRHYAEGVFPVAIQDGLWGYMNLKGELEIPADFNNAYPFSEGIARVLEEGLETRFQYFYIDHQGQRLLNGQTFYRASDFVDGTAAVQRSPKESWGIIDKQGEYIIPPMYQWAGPFSEGLAPVMQDNKIGFINRQGEMKIAPRYYDTPFYLGPDYLHNRDYAGRHLYRFIGGVAAVNSSSGTCCTTMYINKDGQHL